MQYRFYVDELMQDDRISLEEIKYISEKLETKVHEIEDLTKITATTISEITHYTAVTIGPKATEQIIEEIKFVMLGSRMMLAIIMTDSGMVKETIIKFDEDITEKQVESINYIFNNKLKGEPIEKIDKPLEEYLFKEMSDSVRVIKPIIDGEADVVYGSRFLNNKYEGYKKNQIANKILTKFSNFVTGLKVTDMETCYKAFTADFIKNIDIKEKRFGFEPEITAKIAKSKLRLKEVPISYFPRTKEEGKKINIKDGIRAIYCIIKYRFIVSNILRGTILLL